MKRKINQKKWKKKEEENNQELDKVVSDFLSFQDYLNIKNETNINSNQTESRFSNLFKEIVENDKKLSLEEQKSTNQEEAKNKNQDISKENTKNNNYNKFLYSTTIPYNKFDEINFPELDSRKTFYPNLGNFSQNQMSLSTNSSGPYGNSSSSDTFLNYTNSFNKNSFDSNKNSINENKIIQEVVFEPNVDITKILSLEDRRTTIMIKNIPNKFTRELLVSTIDQNFKGTYDLFILPTDGNRNKNFGYSFINFLSSYFIPYFYFMFNNKKWSGTNSKKICEITYSKIQGKANLITYYASKIIYYNNNIQNVNNEQKYIIPNEYKETFIQLFSKNIIEEYNYYFLTKMPLLCKCNTKQIDLIGFIFRNNFEIFPFLLIQQKGFYINIMYCFFIMFIIRYKLFNFNFVIKRTQRIKIK